MRKNKESLNKIVDVHCHILPHIDDGSRNMEETMAMLKIASQSGITDMIVTPHYKKGHHNASKVKIEDTLHSVMRQAQSIGISIKLYPGSEILYFNELEEELEKGMIQTLNGGEHLLIEFLPDEQYGYIRNALDKIAGLGYRPIIAHLERYECLLGHIERVQELHKLNFGIQVNANSIIGGMGYKITRFTHKLLKLQLVDYVASDAHRSDKRSPELRKCVRKIMKLCSTEYTNFILYENAKTMLETEADK